MNISPAQASELIRTRRSIYPASYTGEKVPKEVIEEMLENANWAPTHKMTQPWRFTVFTGGGLKKLAEFQASLYREVSTRRGNFEEKQYLKLQQKPLLCSHIIAIGMSRDPQQKIPEMEEVAATACAVQNMYLTAAAHGVGCYWGTGGITYMEEAKPFFGLGEYDRLLGFFYIGIPKQRHWPAGKRQSIEGKTAWIEEA